MTAFILTAARFPELTIPAPVRAPRRSLMTTINALFDRLNTLRQLRRLNSHQLRDIGLTQADVDPTYAAHFMTVR